MELNSVMVKTIKVTDSCLNQLMEDSVRKIMILGKSYPTSSYRLLEQSTRTLVHSFVQTQTKLLLRVTVHIICFFLLGFGNSGTDECLSVAALYIETGDTDSNPYTCHYPVKVCVSQFTLEPPFSFSNLEQIQFMSTSVTHPVATIA